VEEKAAAILDDYKSRHAEPTEPDHVASIEGEVQTELDRHKEAMATVTKISSEFSSAKADLDRAILQGAAPEDVKRLNDTFEEKARAAQDAEKSLQNAYLEAMAAYDHAIAKNLK
jgi:hypothetical protein